MGISLFSIEGHSRGNTHVTFDDQLDNVITGGNDGNIKVWSGLSNSITLSYNLSSGIKSLVYEKDRIFTASSTNRIAIHSTINTNNTAVLSQFSSDVNYMQISNDKTRLVACSDDFNVKLINLHSDQNSESNSEKREVVFQGHQAPVLSVAINGSNKMMASSSCDGYVIVWDIETKKAMKNLPLLKKVKDISGVKYFCRLKWSPVDAKLLAIPLDEEIRMMNVDTWRVVGTLKWSDLTLSIVTELAFTADGAYLAAGTTDGWIIAWDALKGHIVFSWQCSRGASITGLLWHPKQPHTLLLADKNGFWEAIKVDISKAKAPADADYLTAADLEEMFDDMAEDDEFEIPDEVVTDADTRPLIDLDRESNSTVVMEEQADPMDDMDDMEFDAEDDISLGKLKAEFASPTKSVPESTNQPVTTKVIHVKRQPHPPVRPSQCPRTDNEQLLLWNSVAAFKKHFADEDRDGFLEIDFQDIEVSRKIICKSSEIEVDIGDVNQQAILLVNCQEEEDDDDEDEKRKASRIRVRPVNGSWKAWEACLPVKETPICCCLSGDDYAIVLTDHFMRYFHVTSGGMQTHVESVHGTPVALASTHYEQQEEDPLQDNTRPNRVIVVLDDGQKLVWRLEQMISGHWLQKGRLVGAVTSTWHPLPLTESATLVWIGFSDSGAVYTVDSKQCTRRLIIELESSRSFSEPRWVPVLDFRHAMEKEFRSTDRYFPVAFLDRAESKGAMVVHCRDSRYPSLVPWPHLTMVPFKMPFCAPKTEASELEQSLVINNVLPDWSVDPERLMLTEKQLLLKLFVNALAQHQDSRAFSIARMMPDSQIIQLAIRYCVKINQHGLAERLGQLALQKDEENRIEIPEINEKSFTETEAEDSASEAEESSPEIFQRTREASDGEDIADYILREKENVPAAIPENVPNSPFRVIKTVPCSRRGVAVLDKIVEKKKTSPKKSNAQFGNFTPSDKTFKIKTKRKSVRAADSPLAKAFKK